MHLKSQSGAASIISIAFISIFILILTVAITRLMTGELRHASDLENNIVAYYQAEGGVEEAVLALRQYAATNPAQLLDNATQQNCDKSDPSGPNMDGVLNNFGSISGTGFTYNPNITCRVVRTASSNVSSTLNIDDTAHYDLSKKGFYRMEIQWDSQNLTKESDDLDFFDLQQNPPAPPFLEMTRIQYDNTGPTTNIAPGNIDLKTLYLSPIKSAGVDCGAPAIDFEGCLGVNGKVKVKCSTKPVYRCKATITNFMPAAGSKRTVLRVRPYFSAMQYSIKFYDNLDNPVDVGLDRTVIDVTAKVGSSYRRIEQEISLLPKPVDGLETVFGDDKVCKKFVIFNTGSGEGVVPASIPPDCRLN